MYRRIVVSLYPRDLDMTRVHVHVGQKMDLDGSMMMASSWPYGHMAQRLSIWPIYGTVPYCRFTFTSPICLTRNSQRASRRVAKRARCELAASLSPFNDDQMAAAFPVDSPVCLAHVPLTHIYTFVYTFAPSVGSCVRVCRPRIVRRKSSIIIRRSLARSVTRSVTRSRALANSLTRALTHSLAHARQ